MVDFTVYYEKIRKEVAFFQNRRLSSSLETNKKALGKERTIYFNDSISSVL